MMKIVLLRLLALLFIVTASYVHATNYSSNGGNSSYSLNSGDTLFLQKNNFFGSINNFPTGSVIVVMPNATFTPGTLALWGNLGKIINYGTCSLSTLGIGAGISITNYGTITVHGDMNFYSGFGQTFTNNAGAKLIITGSLTLSDNTSISNNGTLSVGGTISLYSGTASLTNYALTIVGGSLNSNGQINNQNIIRIGGDFNYWAGSVTNTGEINPAGNMSIPAGSTYVNQCKLITKGGINNYGTLQNNGLVWAGTTNTSSDQFTNGGSFIGAPGSYLRTGDFTNYGSITGSGSYYATGTTTLGAGTSIGVSGRTSDVIKVYDVTRSNPNTVFDNQWGTVYPNASYAVFTAPDSIQMYANCSATFKSGSFSMLPVKWNYFNANLSGNEVILNWSAQYEPDMNFDIERSYDGINFISIAIVKSNNTASYTYTDASADLSKTISYRIKGTSAVDGTISYTAIKLIKSNQKENVSVSVYPNPTVDKVSIIYTTDKNEPVTVQLKSANGQQILIKNFVANSGLNQFDLSEMRNVKAGIYFAELVSGNSVISTVKIVKQ